MRSDFWYRLVMWADTNNEIWRVGLRIRAVKRETEILLTPLLWLLGPTTIPWAKIFFSSRSFACRRALTALLAKRCCHRVTGPSATRAVSFTFPSGALTPSDRLPLEAIWKPSWLRLFPPPGCLTSAGHLQPSSGSTATSMRFPPVWPGRGIGAAVWPGRDREQRRRSSKTVMTTAWCRLLQGPPKRRDPSVTERQICATADLRSDGGTQAWSRAFNNGGKHPHPHRGEAPIWIRQRHARTWAGDRRDLDLHQQLTVPPPWRTTSSFLDT
jgi:hypothetical protein